MVLIFDRQLSRNVFDLGNAKASPNLYLGRTSVDAEGKKQGSLSSIKAL